MKTLQSKTRYDRWTAEEDAALGKDPDHVVAKKLRRSVASVMLRRKRLGVRPYAMARFRPTPKQWALIGKLSDAEAAKRIGVTRITITRYRLKHNIPCANPINRPGKN